MAPSRAFFIARDRDERRRLNTSKDDDDVRGNERRRNGDPGARRPGRETSVRLSGRRGAADLRRHLRAGQGAAHPRPPRAGRGARRRRLCALDRQVGLRAGHLRSRRHQRGHRPHRRADGFDPDRLHHRPGADASDRQRRLPGMRHRRHHAALHQVQLPGEAHRGPAARAARGVPYRLERAARARWSSISRRTSSSPRALYREARRAFAHTGYQPAGQGRPRQDQGRRRPDGARQAADVLHRRRRDQLRPARQRRCCANWSS